MLKVALIGISGVLLALQLKNQKPEYAIYISIAVSLLIFSFAFERLSYILDGFRVIQEYISLNSIYISTLIKIVGITYVAEFASDICKDAGYGTIAGQIAVFSKLVILAVSMPVLMALLETITGFLGGST